MADKKTAKKVTNSVKDLRNLSVDELQKQLHTARADLLTAQKSLRANELANPHAVTKLRKQVARILTIITEVNNNDNATNEAEGKEQPERRIHSAPGAMRKTVGLSHKRSAEKETK